MVQKVGRAGIGTIANQIEADRWFHVSARNGDSEAVQAMEVVAKNDNDPESGRRLGKEDGFDVFLSYRRNGGLSAARMLSLSLADRGFRCFFDQDSLRHGKFDAAIFKAIEQASNFIMIVTDGAYDRCSDEKDWVRIEVEYAIKLNRNIVPVAPTGSFRSFPDSLPTSLHALRKIQISRLDLEDLYKESVEKIISNRLIRGDN